MTIEKMSEFYHKGYYSKFDFYLGVIQILSQTEDPDPVLEQIPPSLVDDVVEMADRHYQSAQSQSSFEEARNPEKILQWNSRLPTPRPSTHLATTREFGETLTEGLPDSGPVRR